MKRTMTVLVLLSVVFVPVFMGQGMDLGLRVATQSPSFAIQAEVDVTSSLSVGLFFEFTPDTIADLVAFQTPSFTIGLTTKYHATLFIPALAPYLGVEGALNLPLTETPMSLGILFGLRVYPLRNIYVFAEAVTPILPLANAPRWDDVGTWFKDFYLGIGFRI